MSDIYDQIREVGAYASKSFDKMVEDFNKQINAAYRRVLEDAWVAARKLFSSMADSDIEKAFPIEWNNGGFKALMNLQPQEAISKLKAYEENKDEPIKAGDEMRQVTNNGTPTGVMCTVTTFDGEEMCGFAQDGRLDVCSSQVNRWWKKTGRHHDLEPILEAMKNG